jgi:Protein of unknown function (DUF3142)
MSFPAAISKDVSARSARWSVSTLACFLMVLFIRSEQFPRRNPDRMKSIPSFVLWAWERPEDLRFINPHDTGVAFLADTIRFHLDRVIIRHRLQPLMVPEETKLTAVVRIEADSDAAFSQARITDVVAAILSRDSLPRVVAVQIDFDATRSQRPFYRAFLIELRQRLRPQVPISITALASWCLADDWISTLPVDEAVPMLFRMGAGTNDVVAQLTAGRDFQAKLCQGSLGISTDERWASLPGGRRLYVFPSRSWTEQSELAFRAEVGRWR